MIYPEHTLYIVGAGPGKAELLSDEARGIIARCTCFVAGKHLLALAPAGSTTFAIGASLPAAADFIEENLRSTDVCVLTSGDPGCYSILPFLTGRFRDRIVVAPGISSVQLLAARLRRPWHDWELLSMHGRSKTARLAGRSTAPQRPTLYFCDEDNSPQVVAGRLLKLLGDCPAVAGSDLGRDSERIIEATLRAIAGESFPGNSLLLVMPRPPSEEGVRPIATAPGIPDDQWLRREGIPLSKSEVRAVLLSRAQPAGRRVIWDVGAGTGSYGIECALLAPRARFISIDKNPDSCALVAENAARFGVPVETICGPAPDVFVGLPEPDLVIVGGNDGRLAEIFNGALAALAPGGRILVTALLEKTREAAHAAFAASGLENRQSVKVSVARGQEQHWQEHNPVIIFSGDKAVVQ